MKTARPLVTIICVTYNQEKYIAQALDSFLMQETNFDFEVLVHDDASTDKTTAIVKKYAQKHPDIIKPIFEKKNQYSQGKADFIKDMHVAAKGKYLAQCEGDDYWIDPTKLQRQVDFLESHPDYAMCFHPVEVVFDKKEEKNFIHPDPKQGKKFTVPELIKTNFIQSNSVMYKKQDYKNVPHDVTPLDWYISLYHAQFGKIGFIDRVMSAYRRHHGGLWWASYKDNDIFWKQFGLTHLKFYSEVHKLYGEKKKYKSIIEVYVCFVFNKIIEMDKKYKRNDLKIAMKEYPEFAETYVMSKYDENEFRKETMASQENDLIRMRSQVEARDHAITDLTDTVRGMKSSKFWRARNKAARIVGREVI